MAASENLNPELFHGTAHWFRTGDIVNPTVPATGRVDHKAAWAGDMETAVDYSVDRGRRLAQPPLFTPLVEVETLSPEHELRTHPMIPNAVGDPKGLRVKGIPGYVSYRGTVI